MMKHWFSFFLLALTLTACGQQKTQAPPQAVPVVTQKNNEITGRAVNIADGDTFTLLTGDTTRIKVRLLGIDAPEKKQPFGQKAKEALGQLLEGQQVTIHVENKDRYGRSVADVYANGQWVNLALVEKGYAWWYEEYSKDQRLARAQQDAQARRVGLWSEPHPMAPWDFRKQQKKKRKK